MIERERVGAFVVNFLDKGRKVAVEVDAPELTRQQFRQNRRRDLRLYNLHGIYTLRMSIHELANKEVAEHRMAVFCAVPVPPDPFIETEDEREKKRDRREILKGIKAEVELFERAMIGKTRPEVRSAFSELVESEDAETAVIERIRELVNYWPDEGYSAPNLQKVTANKHIL